MFRRTALPLQAAIKPGGYNGGESLGPNQRMGVVWMATVWFGAIYILGATSDGRMYIH